VHRDVHQRNGFLLPISRDYRPARADADDDESSPILKRPFELGANSPSGLTHTRPDSKAAKSRTPFICPPMCTARSSKPTWRCGRVRKRSGTLGHSGATASARGCLIVPRRLRLPTRDLAASCAVSRNQGSGASSAGDRCRDEAIRVITARNRWELLAWPIFHAGMKLGQAC
jgi:hypothetical protein